MGDKVAPFNAEHILCNNCTKNTQLLKVTSTLWIPHTHTRTPVHR